MQTHIHERCWHYIALSSGQFGHSHSLCTNYESSDFLRSAQSWDHRLQWWQNMLALRMFSNSPVMDGPLTPTQLGFFLSKKTHPSPSFDKRNMRWKLTVGFPIDEPLDMWLRLPASIAPKGVVLSFGLVHTDWPWASNKLRCSCKDIYIDGTFHI